ncbi:MAG: FAD-dependent oxidoreductase [Verrucomicrobiales bacterium]|nr:FAD-dependent oxidoreductase [Verrucomicrobiales bacterium]
MDSNRLENSQTGSPIRFAIASRWGWWGDACARIRWTAFSSTGVFKSTSTPIPTPGHLSSAEMEGNVFLCGDHTTSAPIEGAIRSGLATASQTLERQE